CVWHPDSAPPWILKRGVGPNRTSMQMVGAEAYRQSDKPPSAIPSFRPPIAPCKMSPILMLPCNLVNELVGGRPASMDGSGTMKTRFWLGRGLALGRIGFGL